MEASCECSRLSANLLSERAGPWECHSDIWLAKAVANCRKLTGQHRGASYTPLHGGRHGAEAFEATASPLNSLHVSCLERTISTSTTIFTRYGAVWSLTLLLLCVCVPCLTPPGLQIRRYRRDCEGHAGRAQQARSDHPQQRQGLPECLRAGDAVLLPPI